MKAPDFADRGTALGAITGVRERAPKLAIAVSWCALGLGFAFTLSVAHWLQVEEATLVAERFEQRTDELVGAISDRLRTYEQVLQGCVGLFAASQAVTRDEWRTYVERLSIEERYPGIQGIGYTQRVMPADLHAHIERVRREGFPAYTVRPLGARAQYTPVVYLEPFRDRNLRAFGYDMYSEPVRRAAMERARDEGRAAISGPVTLVQETEREVQPGFLMYLPVYRRGARIDTVSERRAALVGYVYSPFRVHDFMRGLRGDREPDVAIALIDGVADTSDRVMYADALPQTKPVHARAATIALNGHFWTIRVVALPAFEAQRDWQKPAIVLGLGTATTLLLWFVLRAMAGTQARAVRLAVRITAALRDSEQVNRLILDTARDAFITMDADGRIRDWNREAAAMFGWSCDEAMGRTVAETIVPDSQRSAHVQGLRRHLETGEARVLNQRIELAARHRDGHQFLVEATIVPLTVGGKRFFSAFLRDISGRVTAELRLHESLAELKRSNQDLEQFAYVASHDLQEPLRAVTSCLQLLERRNDRQMDDGSRTLLGHAVTGATRMRQLIDDLLLYSRVHTRARPPEPVDTQELVERLLAEETLLIAEHGAQVTLGRLPVVLADSTQLRQVFQNLIANACKFRAAEASRITIGAERRGGEWIFAVADNGIGIAPQYFDRIFVAFQRLHTRDKYPGTGIGLAICKKIIERHGGLIWVESAPGRGATFYFSLPAAADALEEAAA